MILGQHKQDANVRYLTAERRVVIGTKAIPCLRRRIIGETLVEVTVVLHALHVIVPRNVGAWRPAALLRSSSANESESEVA